MKRVQGTKGVVPFECINPGRNRWSVRWDIRENESEVNPDAVTYMEETFNFKPDLSDVQDIVSLWCESEDIVARFILDGQPIISNESALTFMRAKAEQALKDNCDSFSLITTGGVIEVAPAEALYIIGKMTHFLWDCERNTMEKQAEVADAEELEALLKIDFASGFPVPSSMTLDDVRVAIASERKTPEQQAVIFARKVINTVELENNEALSMKDLHPTWESFIGKSLNAGFRVLYQDRLYRVRQDIDQVLESHYPSIDTAALYEEITEEHAGTLEDPIPYNNNMELFSGKYYLQGGVIYKCFRDTGAPVYSDLADLVAIYVEII